MAAEVIRTLPNESIVYLADNAHVPYGERPLEQIREFALGITRFLIDRGAKAVVMACNMSSAVALDAAQAAFPEVPVLGVIGPGARAAVQSCGGDPIGVLATTGTVKSGAYSRTVSSLSSSIKVIEQACPRFVPLVESGQADSEEAEAAARTYVAPMLRAGCRTIVLGCTHYPFLRKAIQAAAGPEVTIVDPAEETSRLLDKTLSDRGIKAAALQPTHAFYSSGDTDGFATIGSAFLGRAIESVRTAQWGVDIGRELRDVAV